VTDKKTTGTAAKKPVEKDTEKTLKPKSRVKEFGGRDGLEPTRYGDWENKGIISDF